jgi:3-oxoacyl-[acyl-carrier protein] reductase
VYFEQSAHRGSAGCVSAGQRLISEHDHASTGESSSGPDRPVALVTGAGRTAGIGAGIATQLAASGWDIAFTYWTAYDKRMRWGIEAGATGAIERSPTRHGAAVAAIEADLTDTGSPGLIFDETERRLGNVTALVICHCESVDSGLLDTTVESFDRHFAVNARATWLLIREYGRRFRGRRRGDLGVRRRSRRPACRGAFALGASVPA